MRRIRSGGAFEGRIGYCRAVVAGGWIHVSGTVCPPDANTGLPPPDIAAQCHGALKVIRKALAEAAADWSDVVRVTYILPDSTLFPACWPILSATFGAAPPAATMIGAGLIAPECLIEIEVTAYRSPAFYR